MQMRSVHNLSLGTLDPSYCDGVANENSAYAPRQGLPVLRELLARRYDVTPDEILVTAGASMALISAFLVCPADATVAFPRPGFPAYEAALRLINRKYATYDLSTGWDNRLLDIIQQDSPHVIILNSPGNPLGNVIKDSTRKRICELAQSRGVMIILDETYSGLEFPGTASSGALLGPAPGIIRIGSFSKRFSKPGLRIGYAIAAPETCRKMTDVNWVVAMSPCSSSQIAASELQLYELKESGYLPRMVARLEASCNTALEVLKRYGVEPSKPQGGPILWIELPGFKGTGYQITTHCLHSAGIALSPGETFGHHDTPAVRCSYAIPPKDIPLVFDQLGQALADWRQTGCQGK